MEWLLGDRHAWHQCATKKLKIDSIKGTTCMTENFAVGESSLVWSFFVSVSVQYHLFPEFEFVINPNFWLENPMIKYDISEIWKLMLTNLFIQSLLLILLLLNQFWRLSIKVQISTYVLNIDGKRYRKFVGALFSHRYRGWVSMAVVKENQHLQCRNHF